MAMNNQTDFEKLEYPNHDSKVTSHFSFVHNLFLRNNLRDGNLKIDDNLSIVSKEKGIKYVAFLTSFLKVSRNINHVSGTYFLYKYSKERKYYFEAEDRVRMFITAVRIYKNNRCDCKINYSIGDKTCRFYRPYDFFEITSDLFGIDGKSYIESRMEFNVIKKIYNRLKESQFEKTIYYSRIYNAVKFFNHSYDEPWTLLKTTLAITTLESLFSDSAKSEITYKVAIRAAYFLYPHKPKERKDVFDLIKYAYDIRNNFVHGSDVERKLAKIEKKLHERKGGDYYSFHYHFARDLGEIVTKCLSKALLEDRYFNFFNSTSNSSQEESDFYDQIVILNK